MRKIKSVSLKYNFLEVTPDASKEKQTVSNVTIDDTPQEEEMNPYKRALPKPVKEVKSPKVSIENKLFKINSPSERNHKFEKGSDEGTKKQNQSKGTR